MDTLPNIEKLEASLWDAADTGGEEHLDEGDFLRPERGRFPTGYPSVAGEERRPSPGKTLQPNNCLST
jgi:hypothetical protein